MSQGLTSSRLYYSFCCFVLFLSAASASFNGFYSHTRFNESSLPGAWYQSTFESLLSGTGYRPYVYRQLLPDFANWLDRIAPQSVKSSLYSQQWNLKEPYLVALSFSPVARDRNYFFRYLVFYLTDFLCALFAVFAMYRICIALNVYDPAAVFAPVIIILIVPYVMSGSGYYYDFPELALFALAFWIALKADWWWLLPLAILGTWNKESFLFFLASLYPIIRMRSSRLSSRLGVGILCFTSGLVYLWLRARFAHNPGGAVIWCIRDEFDLLMHPRSLFLATKDVYGLRMISGYTVGPVALAAWSVWRAWRFLPRAIQRHGQIAAGINIPLYLLFGQPGKLRDLSMLYIIFLLVLAVDMTEWMHQLNRRKSQAGQFWSARGISAPVLESQAVENDAGKEQPEEILHTTHN